MKKRAVNDKLGVAYRRVSTEDQADSGAGLAAQRDSCHRWAALNKVTLIGEYEEEEGVEGNTPLARRPKLISAVEQLKTEGAGVFLVGKRDRIMRDRVQIALFESAVLKPLNARLVSAAGEGTELDPSDPMGFLLRAIVDVFAEFEKLMIAFRTSGALQAKRSRGERNGRIPYGYKLTDDGRRSKTKTAKDGTTTGGLPIALVDDPDEMTMIEFIVDSMQTGTMSAREVSRRLADEGYLSRAGKPLHHSTVLSLYRYHLERLNNARQPAATTRGDAPDPADAGRRTA